MQGERRVSSCSPGCAPRRARCPGGVADAQAASWSCRASAVSASLAGNPATEPLVANSGFTPCVSAAAGPQNVGAFAGAPANAISALTASAETRLGPAGAAPAAQTIAAVGRVEGLSIQLPPGGGGLTLGVRVATARVTGACTGGAPALTGSSEAAGLSISGTEVPLQQALTQLRPRSHRWARSSTSSSVSR